MQIMKCWLLLPSPAYFFMSDLLLNFISRFFKNRTGRSIKSKEKFAKKDTCFSCRPAAH